MLVIHMTLVCLLYVCGEAKAKSMADNNVIVTTVLDTPFMMRHHDQNKEGNGRYGGYFVDILEEMSKLGGFNYTIREGANGNFGYLDPSTGRWNGMIGELIEKKADVAVGRLSMTRLRQRAVEFGDPVEIYAGLVVKKPARGGVPINSVEEFLADVNNRVLVVRYGNTHQRLMESESPQSRALLARQWKYKTYSTTERDGVQQVLASSHKGYLMEAGAAEYIAGRACSLKVLPTDLQLHPQSWAYPVDSPIRDTWARLFTEVVADKGLMAKWWRSSC